MTSVDDSDQGGAGSKPDDKYFLRVLIYAAAANTVFTLIRSFIFAYGGQLLQSCPCALITGVVQVSKPLVLCIRDCYRVCSTLLCRSLTPIRCATAVAKWFVDECVYRLVAS